MALKVIKFPVNESIKSELADCLLKRQLCDPSDLEQIKKLDEELAKLSSDQEEPIDSYKQIFNEERKEDENGQY